MAVMQNEKIAGIIGGMGPEATVDLLNRIIRLTPALDDIDHVRCVVDNNPKVPSRMKALIDGTGENPGPVMAEMARRLESWGVDFLAIPCNTAHYYYDDVQKAVRIPVINMLDLTVQAVLKAQPNIRQVGILASTAVIRTALYQQRFSGRQVGVVYPEDSFQENLLLAIKRIKQGTISETVRESVQSAVRNLESNGAEALVIACTELSIMEMNSHLPVFDAADILARHIIRVCKHNPA